jgi:hypothetical protein
MQIGETTCSMVFMVINIDNYDVFLELDFLIKIEVVVDVERRLIQVRQGPISNVQVLPLDMVNMLQLVDHILTNWLIWSTCYNATKPF